MLLASPQGVVALVSQVSASLIALYVPNIRCLLWVLSCIPALVGVIIVRGSMTLFSVEHIFFCQLIGLQFTDSDQVVDVSKHRIFALIGLYLMGFYNVSWILAMSLISSNTAGATKKSLGSVSIGIFYGSVNPFLPFHCLGASGSVV